MRKVIIALAASLVLAGCGKVDRTVASYTGYALTCVDGIE